MIPVLPIPKLRISVSVFDGNKEIVAVPLRDSHSFVKNMWIGYFRWTVTPQSGNVEQGKNTDNTSIYIPTLLTTSFPATVGAEYGILVGSSDTAETFSDYNLATRISHGSGSGELYHNEHTSSYTDNGATDKTVTRIRTFSNYSGSAIDVKEVGIRALSGGTYWTIARDVLASTVTVGDDQLLQVTYQMVFPWSS